MRHDINIYYYSQKMHIAFAYHPFIKVSQLYDKKVYTRIKVPSLSYKKKSFEDLLFVHQKALESTPFSVI